MNCSHGIRYESKCPACVEEGIEAVKAKSQTQPPTKDHPQERSEFFRLAYKGTIQPNNF